MCRSVNHSLVSHLILKNTDNMWTPVVFLFLVGFVAGGQAPWKQDQQYTYEIYARTLTAIPELREQYVGVVTIGKIVLQAQSGNKLIGKLIKAAHAHFHDDLQGGWNREIPRESLNFQDSELNNKPFRVELKNGVVESLLVDQSMSNDQVNQLKAILSQLQVDITGENLIKSKHNQLPEENRHLNAFFKTMEASVTGECETDYEISPMQDFVVQQSQPEWAPNTQIRGDGEFFEIVKYMNYSNCDERKGYHYGITGHSNFKPNTNQMGNIVSKSSVSRIIANGPLKSYTIEQSTTTNRISVSPSMYQEQKAQVISQIQLTLSSVHDITSRLEEPKEVLNTGNLVYRYNLPSDKDNKIRIDENNYNARQHGASRSSSSSSSSESDEHKDNKMSREYEVNEISGKRFPRSTKSFKNSNEIRKERKNKSENINSSSSSSSSDSSSSEEENRNGHSTKRQPKPTMTEAPEFPFHPLFIGNQGRSVNFYDKINIEEEARKMAQEIAEDLQNQDEITKRNTLEKFDILVDLIRVMSQQQIQNVARKVNVGSDKHDSVQETMTRNTFQDAVAQSGTGPAVSVVIRWLTDRQVKGEEAAALLSTLLREIRTPTDDVVRALFQKIVKNDQIRSQQHLYSTVIFAFTNFIRRASVDKDSAYNHYPVQSFGSFRNQLQKIVEKEIIPHFAQRLEVSVQENNIANTLLYIRAMGNIAHPQIIKTVEKYMENENLLSDFQRRAMVLALDKLSEIYPRNTRDILYNIYANINEKPETRSVAVLLLMKTEPPAAMLQRMAEYTNEDPSEAVQSIVKSAILSASELERSDLADFAANAQAAKHFLNPREYGNQYSKTTLRDYVANEVNLAYKSQLSHIIGDAHVLPKGIFYSAFKNFGGLESRSEEVQVMVSSIEQVVNMWPSPQSENQNKKSTKSYPDSESKYSTERIAKALNLESNDAEQLQGQILMNLMGRKQFMAFDEKTIKGLPEMIAAGAALLKNGQKIRYNRLFDRRQVSIAFPTATGYPFIYTFRMPTLVQALGEVQAKSSPEMQLRKASWQGIKNTEAVNLTAEVHLVYSTQEMAKVGFVTPFDRQRYVAGYIKKAQAHFPLKLKINMDLVNQAVSGKLSPIEGKQDFKPFHASAWPFTVRKNAMSLRPASEAEDIKNIQSRPQQQHERTIGEKSTGMAYRYRIEHQLPAASIERLSQTLEEQGVIALTRMPYSYQSVMTRLMREQSLTPYDILPYAFEPAMYGSNTAQTMLSLATLPFYDELTSLEILKTQGLLSLITLPLADSAYYAKTSEKSGFLSAGTILWPGSTLDHYSLNIKYDAQRSANKDIKFTLNLKKAHNVNEESNRSFKRMKMSASIDENKLAMANDASPNSGERREQLLENAAFGIQQASVGLIDASIVFDGEKRSEYVATIVQADSPVDEKERVLVYLSAKPAKSSKSQQVAMTYTGKYPNTPALNFEEALRHNGKSSAKVQIVWGENGKPAASPMNMRVLMEQTNEFKQHIRQSLVAQRCQQEMSKGYYQMPACLNAIYHANILDHVEITVESEKVNPTMRNITILALAILRHAGIYSLDVNVNEMGQSNRIEAILRIAPHQKYINATIQTYNKKYEYTNLPIDPQLRPLFTIHPGFNFDDIATRNAYTNGQLCVLDKENIYSFDNAVIENQKIGKAWYAMVQFSAPQYRNQKYKQIGQKPKEVSILVRQADASDQMRELKIIVGQSQAKDHVVNLYPRDSSLHVKINGEEHKLSDKKSIDVHDNNMIDNESEPALRIYALPSNEIEVLIRGKQMKVYYNGKSIRVHADPSYRNQTLGLCGTYNGEQVDDLTTPKQCVLWDNKYFAASWAIVDDSTNYEVQQAKQKSENARCSPINYTSGNIIKRVDKSGKTIHWTENSSSSSSSSESSSKENRKEQGNNSSNKNSCQLKKQMRYIESDGQVCFSLKKLSVCPTNCVSGRKERETVQVYCRDSTDSVARMYTQQIRKGATPDLSGKEATKSITFNIPTDCSNRY